MKSNKFPTSKSWILVTVKYLLCNLVVLVQILTFCTTTEVDIEMVQERRRIEYEKMSCTHIFTTQASLLH